MFTLSFVVFHSPMVSIYLFTAENSGTESESTTFMASNDLGVPSLSQIELSEADDRMKRFYGMTLF